MKNFSDLLATDPILDIWVMADHEQRLMHWPLARPLNLTIANARSVKVDGMEMIDFGYFQDQQWIIHHDKPFYQWRHEVTGQGWLLKPVKA